MVKFNFTQHYAAQDMINIIAKDKQLSLQSAIGYSITKKNYTDIIKNGWADIALSLWGHADLEREWEELENPCLEVDLDAEQSNLVNEISIKYKVDFEEAVSYFLIFTMHSLGYHV